MDEDTLKMLARLKQTSDGKDFIEYLQQLSKENYISWKDAGGDLLRGKAIAIDNLIKVFENCADRLVNQQVMTKEWM
jgi:hypothetical protein